MFFVFEFTNFDGFIVDIYC